VPYLSYVPIVPSDAPYRHASGLWRDGTATSLRLPVRLFPRGAGDRCAVKVSLRVISPSVHTVKLPVAGCWR